LLEALKDADHRLADEIVSALGCIGAAAAPAVPALAALLEDPNTSAHKHYVSEALGKIGPAAKAAVPALRRYIQATSGYDRIWAAEALWLICKDPTALPVLLEELTKGGHNNQAYAAAKLGAMGDAARPALPHLINALRNESRGGSPAAAAAALGNLGAIAENAIPQLLANVKEGRAVEAAALALWRIAQHPEAIPALTKLVGDEDHFQRRHAIGVLGEIGPPARSAIPTLSRLVKDDSAWVRKAAAVALGGIGHADAVPALVQFLDDPIWCVRSEAAVALGKMGPAAKAAAPALRRLLNDELVRPRAREALRAMGLESEVRSTPPLFPRLSIPDLDRPIRTGRHHVPPFVGERYG